MLTAAKILKDLQAVDNQLHAKISKAPKSKTAGSGGAARPSMARFKFLCALEGLAKLSLSDEHVKTIAEAYVRRSTDRSFDDSRIESRPTHRRIDRSHSHFCGGE